MMTFRFGRTRLGRTALGALLLSTAGLLPAGNAAAAAPAATERPSLTSATGSYLAGRFAQRQDDWAAAALFMAHALSADPGDLTLLRRTYLLKLGEGQFDAAIDLAKRLLEQDNDPQMAIALLASDNLARGKLKEAKAMAARMPKEGMAKYIGPLVDAWLAAAEGKTDAALKALEPLSTASGFAALHDLHAGLVLELGGRKDAAAERFARVLDKETPLRVIQIVGSFYERTGRKDEARKLYEAFRAGNPDSLMVEPALKALDEGKTTAPVVSDAKQGLAEALFDLGSAIHHEGAEETALLFGRIALHLRPDLSLARLMIGDIMENRDHHADALVEFQALEKDPVLGWTARLRAAESLARLERTDDAIAAFSSLSAERPERTDALIRLGDLYRVAKRYGEAADSYSKALERIGTPEERHWAVLYARAMSYDKVDRWPDAERDLRAALALKPDEAFLLNYLGYSYVDRGLNLEEAKTMIEKAVALRPKDGYIVDSLGWALYRTGDFEGAVEKLERAVELKPTDATINDHLGDAYWRVGRRNEARFQWTRALRTAEEEPLKEDIQAKLDKGLVDPKAAEAAPPKVQ
ncbi:tetratricopeptide repeat protein (plasmid) [Azospirillum argentinense]|uniref:Tetratricopeptide repeat protein n=1 Tax=Azospirillum argentinense TaxID=2970906 RepID=A0A2K1FRX1_9PROT|nr:tetratricopeptide repeat protein [Azospirillum argentinense]